MGQRTQALIRYNHESAQGNARELASVSLHYQWGYGKVMLMDVLNIAWAIHMQEWDFNVPSKKTIADFITSHSTGHLNFDLDGTNAYTADNELLKSWGIKPYHETMDNVIKHSDNNNGYVELTLTENMHDFDFRGTLSCYDNGGRKVTLHEYAKGTSAADTKFQHAYRDMLASFDITIQ